MVCPSTGCECYVGESAKSKAGPERVLKRELPFTGMKFATTGELTERPFSALGGAGGITSSRGCAGSFRTPICRGGMNTPHVAGFVERYPNHPPLTSGTERHAVGDTGRDTLAAGQFVQGNCLSRFQFEREPYATTLRIEHKGMSGFGKWVGGIQAGHAKRNLRPNAGAAPA